MMDKKVNTKIVRSSSYNPWYNQALEEYLLNQVSEKQVILYLWQNEDTVVIGKHQNAWKECRWQQLEKDGGKLARRLSGGGAVFHDLGNLNFTFIMDRKLYDLEKQIKVVLHAVKELGIKGELSGRNDLIVGGKKFSGSAFYFKTNAALHHGTLLINTDLTKLARYLQVSKEKITSKGIDSVRARVVNLSDIDAKINVDTMFESLKRSFINIYGGTIREIQMDPVTEGIEDIEKLYQKYASWEWRYGETPKFDIFFTNRFTWGDIEIGLSVKNGYITSSVVYSDALDYDLIEALSLIFKDLPFQKDLIVSKVDSISTNDEGRKIIKDLTRWLNSKQF